MTRNHNLETPDPGTTDWHIPINKNFKLIDDKLEIRDTKTNLGQYDPVTNAKFFATDTEEVFIGDGSDWSRVASFGKNPTYETVESGEILNTSSEAAIHTAWDGLVVPVAEGLGASDAVDPKNTDTPVQDAIDKIGRSSSGSVLLPKGTVVEEDSVSGGRGKSIVGFGSTAGSELIFASDTDGLTQDGSVTGTDWESSYIDGITISGGEPSNRSRGSAINFSESDIRRFNVSNLRLSGWGGSDSVIDMNGAVPYDSAWSSVRIENAETSSGTGYVEISNGSSGGVLKIENLLIDGQSNGTGVFTDSSVHLLINLYKTAGSVARALAQRQGGSGGSRIGTLQHTSLADSENASSEESLVSLSGGQYFRVDGVNIYNAETDWIITVSGSNMGNICVGEVVADDTAEIREGVWNQTGTHNEPSYYWGTSGDVENNTGDTLNKPVVCLGDLKKVRLKKN